MTTQTPATPAPLTADALLKLCLNAGADDVGLVSIHRSELDTDRADITAAAPWARSLVSFVCRMNREPIRTPFRSMANLEFHHAGEQVDKVARKVVEQLERIGVRALNPSMGFPMEVDRFPGKLWVISHKLVAEAAGLGRMGLHRNLIHPRFGNFILLGTLITDLAVEEEGRPLTGDVCMDCKLCVAACPVGAIGADGHFDFSACYSHNYREFMGGFVDWVEQVAGAGSAKAYRKQVTDSETVSMWQSLSYGANYKAAYCLAVCPAGEDVFAPFAADRKQFIADTLKPLTENTETVYVVPGSDAETHVQRRFPHKPVERIGGVLRPATIDGFIDGMPMVFQRGKAKGIRATYHFTFTGKERGTATVVIDDGQLTVTRGHEGRANLKITVGGQIWLGFLAGNNGLFWATLTGRFWLWGNPKHLLAFARCFPALKR